MLVSKPLSRGDIVNWKKVMLLRIPLFENYWRVLGSAAPLIDPLLAYYDEWSLDGHRYKGFRDRETLLK